MKKKISELKAKSKNELEKEVQALREEISKLKLEFKVNPGKDTNILAKKTGRKPGWTGTMKKGWALLLEG